VRVALLSRAAHPLHPPGGLERAVYFLAKHLASKGASVVLFTRPATCKGAFPGEVVSVEYESVGGLAHGGVLGRTLNYPRFSMRVGEAVAERVRSQRVDIVHAQGLTALGYARLRRAEPALRAPLVMNPQGMEEHKTSGLKRFALFRLRALSREAARGSDRVIATDQTTRREVQELLGVANSSIVVLPNGIDLDEVREKTPREPEQVASSLIPSLGRAFPIFLSVGRLEAYKGFGDILDALSLLFTRGELPTRWAWVVVGEGPEGNRLARRVRALEIRSRFRDRGMAPGPRGLAEHIHFAGRVPEDVLHALYARADVFVHATHFEGSSLVTLEAMAHGLPVVATRAGGIPDKVVDGVTGRLVPPGDVRELSRRLAEMASDARMRSAMGEKGRERALEYFNWSKIADETLALYEVLLRGTRS